jgi:hypothetical protein
VGKAGIHSFYSGEAEIRYSRFVRRIEEDICRFKIAVENATLMSMLDGPRNLCHHGGGISRLQMVRLYPGGKRTSFDQFHAEKPYAIALSHLVYRDDVWMPQSSCGFGLALEPASRFFSGETRG